MKGSKHPRIKICCISSVAEAQLAVEYGAAVLGLVGPMPSGPGIIDDETIGVIARQTPPGVSTFLLTSEQTAPGVIAHHQRVNTSTIQLVDSLIDEGYDEIRAALPAIKLVQVIHVVDESSIDEALSVQKHVDAILLDSGNPNLEVKELGGTGRVHNWDISRTIREHLSIPMFLAGGLNESNVREAIEYVQPYGLDLCSSVRTDDTLDESKLKRFFEKAASD